MYIVHIPTFVIVIIMIFICDILNFAFDITGTCKPTCKLNRIVEKFVACQNY